MAQSGEGNREDDGASLFQLRGHPPPDYIKEKAGSLCWKEITFNCYCYWSKPVAGDQNQQIPTDVPSDLLGSVPETLSGDWVITEKIKTALFKLRWIFQLVKESIMIQFWAPRRIESRSFLTVSHQPFVLGGVLKTHEGLWSYRKYCESFECNVEEGEGTSSGPPGRVFSRKLLESSPDVSRYSCNEFPLRDVAVNCGVKSMVTLPLLEPSSCGRCIGVLEFVSLNHSHLYLFKLPLIVPELQNSEGQLRAMDEIRKMFKKLKHSHELYLAQFWAPCKSSNAMASGDHMDGNSNSCHLICNYDLRMITDLNEKSIVFHEECTNQPLRRGHGIVWKTLRIQRPCFCSDIGKFSIIEYPLAHRAHECELTLSFAISVRSSYTGDLDYVLEFFLPKCRPIKYRDDKTLLGSILATMKRHLTSFKVSSGKELGKELTADIVEGPTLTDELHSSSEYRTIRSPKTLQSKVEVVQVDSSSQQSTAEEAYENGVEQSKIALSGWPSCKRKKVKPTHSNLKNLNESVQSIEERIPKSSRKDPSCHNRRMQDAAPALVTIKATYADDIIKFQITSSSTMAELLENLIERLPSAGRNFRIKYQDDDGDWVLLACEKDMQYCLTSLGTIRSPKTLQSKVEVVQVDSSSQQSTAEEASENGVEQSKIALTSLQNQCLMSKKGKDITHEALKPYFGTTTLDNVAEIFGVSRSKMKRSCKSVEIFGWPSCKRKKVKPTHSNLKNLNESVQSIEEKIPESSRKDPSCDNRRMQDAAPTLVTIKATYADNNIKFRITSSSTMAELLENLTERLPLTGISFRIEYHNDEDFIEILHFIYSRVPQERNSERLLKLNLEGQLHDAMDEIDKMLKMLEDTHELPLVQIWRPCRSSNAMASGDYPNGNSNSFHLICYDNLTMTANSSDKSSFCPHAVQKTTEIYGDDKTLLGSILATMKQHLRSFKVSSGKELGEELTADIMEVFTLTDELHSFSECRNIRSPENLQSEVKVVHVCSSSQQSTAEEAYENCVEQSKV
ncbi:hypothetical protein RJ640_019068 [Escallonia rubra]|uniref:Uncharacterized protein n=1 Tax=Escallonia rubra TaxID=112253 RepID=A0AA88RSN7_9ASTE|nr:hypothetical protein RJ640_019068 [Escallonia rubra]